MVGGKDWWNDLACTTRWKYNIGWESLANHRGKAGASESWKARQRQKCKRIQWKTRRKVERGKTKERQGTKNHGRALCSVKSDSAQALTEAVKQLDWLPEPGLPNDPYHDAKLESNICRIKEGTCAIHWAARFSHEMWPRSIEYFCIAKSFTTQAPIHLNDSDEVKNLKQGRNCYEAANNGEPFQGLRVPLGALVYYKPPGHANKPAFKPRTLPGIFVEWRMDTGFKHRKIHLVLDYESARCKSKGFGKAIQVHETELVVPGHHAFPLYQAEQSQLEGGTGELTKIALPFGEGAPPTPGKVRRTYVTLDRASRFGKAVGCKGCDRIAEGVKHSEACHERFRSLLEKEKVEKTNRSFKISWTPTGGGGRRACTDRCRTRS